MSERAARSERFGTTGRSAVFAFVLSSTTLGQSVPATQAELPRIDGRVVRESDGSPVAGAHIATVVEASADACVSDEHGRFVVPSSVSACAPRPAPGRRGPHVVQFLRIEARDSALVYVDPCSDAPWAQPIPLRPAARLRGRVTNAGPKVVVRATAEWRDVCWPPRTGLTRPDEEWTAKLDADGRFAFVDLPAQVPLTLATVDNDMQRVFPREFDLVLEPGAQREVAYDQGKPSLKFPPFVPEPESGAKWIPVDAQALGPDGVERSNVAFDVLAGGRWNDHALVGGGRWHLHGFRACNCLEVIPGPRTVIARDPSGWFGLVRFEALPSHGYLVPRVNMAPGGLVRIEFDGPERHAHVSFSYRSIEFARRDVPRGVVWYEPAPAGTITARVTSTDADARTSELEVTAGIVHRLTL